MICQYSEEVDEIERILDITKIGKSKKLLKSRYRDILNFINFFVEDVVDVLLKV